MEAPTSSTSNQEKTSQEKSVETGERVERGGGGRGRGGRGRGRGGRGRGGRERDRESDAAVVPTSDAPEEESPKEENRGESRGRGGRGRGRGGRPYEDRYNYPPLDETEFHTKIEELNNKAIQLDKQHKKIKSQIWRKDADRRQLFKERQNLKQNINAIASQKQEFEDHKSALDLRLHKLQETRDRRNRELSQMKMSIPVKKQDKENDQDYIQRVAKAYDEAIKRKVDQIAIADSSLENRLRREIDGLQKEKAMINPTNNSSKDSELRISEMRDERKMIDEKIRETKKEISTLIDDRKKIAPKLQAIEEEMEKLNQKLKTIEVDYNKATDQINAVYADLDAKRLEHRDKRREYIQKQKEQKNKQYELQRKKKEEWKKKQELQEEAKLQERLDEVPFIEEIQSCDALIDFINTYLKQNAKLKKKSPIPLDIYQTFEFLKLNAPTVSEMESSLVALREKKSHFAQKQKAERDNIRQQIEEIRKKKAEGAKVQEPAQGEKNTDEQKVDEEKTPEENKTEKEPDVEKEKSETEETTA